MSDPVKELTYWQPWQLHELNQWEINAKSIASLEPQAKVQNESLHIDSNEILKNIHHLDKLKEEANQLGFQQGYEHGQKTGYQEGFKQGLKEGERQGLQQTLADSQPMIDTWKNLLSEFNDSINEFDSVISTKLLQIALAAAKQVIEQSTNIDNTALIENINQLLRQKPLFSEPPELHIHPAYRKIIEQHLGPQLNLNGWRIIEDPQLHLGGCRVIAEDGEIDMSVATRWKELCKLYAPKVMS